MRLARFGKYLPQQEAKMDAKTDDSSDAGKVDDAAAQAAAIAESEAKAKAKFGGMKKKGKGRGLLAGQSQPTRFDSADYFSQKAGKK